MNCLKNIKKVMSLAPAGLLTGCKRHAAEIPLLLVIFFTLLLIQGAPFLKGYRLTADDVIFHHYVMSGWSASWSFIKENAFGQGRFVHFVDLPFSLFGAYFADNYIFRIFYTGLYFTNFVLLGWYVSLVLFNRYLHHIALLVAVILISFHPLDYYHLAPTAYPFHVSLPVFLILISRIRLWVLRDSISSKSSGREAGWLFVCFVGMIFSEYGFLFGISIVLAEYFARVVRTACEKRIFLSVVFQWLRHRYFLQDLLLMALFIALYLGFRSYYPSGYEGNKISSNFSITLFAKTLFGHIYGGTSIASFIRHDSFFTGAISQFYFEDYFLLAAVFFGTYFVSNRCVIEIISNQSLKFKRSELIIVAAIGALVALFITTPVALTAKYQGWCADINHCIFLDSRVSFLGVGVCIFVLLIYLITRKFINSKLIVLASLIIAFVAAFSYINNKRISIDMSDYSSAWDKGKKLVCVTKDDLKFMSKFFSVSSFVDPMKRVSYHAHFDVENYWAQYLDDQRSFIHCEQSVPISSFFPPVTFGQPMLFKKGTEAVDYLQSGWSVPESWGTWSDSSSSYIFFPIASKMVDSISIEFGVFIGSSHPLQRIEIFVNGMLTSSLAVREPTKIVEIKLTESAKFDSFSDLKIEFRLPDAASPRDVGLGDDHRKLGLGLKAITLR